MVEEAQTVSGCAVEVLALGDEDDGTAVPLAARLDSALATRSHIVVDVRRASRLDKALATSLRSAHERLAGEGRAVALVVSPGDVARRVHRLGLDRALPMYVTPSAAVAALSGARPGGNAHA